ncbi:MAG: glycosyltransferase family 39 protein [Candidatus Omnitrophica bacterium]|nr:glycosyltransferase family 39 protein [Candidatus Omnitrophota bacterium]
MGNLRNLKISLLLVVIIAISIRLINIKQPLLEAASVRQTENAQIARNFYQDGMDILYPYLVNEGGQKAYQLVEFPLIPYMGALLYFLMGGVHEFALRLISVFFFACAALFLYRLAKIFFDEEIALYAILVFSFSPVSIFLSRSFQYEMAMIFFIIATIYFFYKWVESGSGCMLIASAFCFSLAVLLKAPNLYLLAPLSFLAFRKYGLKAFLDFRLYLFLLFTFAVIFIWYRHAHNVMITFPNRYSAYYTEGLSYVINNMKYYLRHLDFYKANFNNLITYTLTPVGFTLCGLGLFLNNGKNIFKNLLYVWLLSVAVFFIMIPAQSMQGYYQIHFLPVLSIMIAKATKTLKGSDLYSKNLILSKKIVLTVFIIIISFTVCRYAYSAYMIPENFKAVVDTGKRVDGLIEKDALIIASIENGTELIYYCNRRGWPFLINPGIRPDKGKIDPYVDDSDYRDPIDYLERLRSKGADYFVSASLKNEFLGNERFSKYMFEYYKLVEKGEGYIIFDLKNRF